MGYDIDRFVDLSPAIAENFKCSICLDIFKGPLELPCGHIFCLECLRGCFDSGSTCECPECRQRVVSRDVKLPNRKLLCLLHSLNIKCEFADRGCCMVIKLENILAHTRECQFNTSPKPNAPLEYINYGNHETIMDLLGDDSYLMERLERLHIILASFTQMMNENEEELNEISYDGISQDDNELLIDDDTSCKRILWGFIVLIGLILYVLLLAAPIAAIVISTLKLHSCTEIPTLPSALLALGLSLLAFIILETLRNFFYEDKFCVGLKVIQAFALGCLIYLAIIVYSNLGMTCDYLLFEFTLWLVSGLLALIFIMIVALLLFVIFINLKTIWSEWERSYVLLTFIYMIPISGVVISVSAMAMGSIFFNSCPDIPNLTTKVVVFGTLGFMCWIIMLINSKLHHNSCFWMFLISVIVSFICVAVPVHNNFPWYFTSDASLDNIDCNATIYTYSFVMVCVNYVIIGLSIFMYLVYGGICACLFFK